MVKLQLSIMLQFGDQTNSHALYRPVMVFHWRRLAVRQWRNFIYPCQAHVWVSSVHKRQGIYCATDQLGANKLLRSFTIAEPRHESTKSPRLLVQGKQSFMYQ